MFNYKILLNEIVSNIQTAQIKAAMLVNAELIFLYWKIGKLIAERQRQEGWSAKVIPNLAKDLNNEISHTKGFSERNLGRMLAFYKAYPDEAILPQAVAKLPWGHNILLLERVKDTATRFWYIHECIKNEWSRNTLDLQLKSQLHLRIGKSISNFSATLPRPLSDLAQESTKDPYHFDFFSMLPEYQERDIENQLIQHISQFLLELGKGFAFVGKQYHLVVADNDYYLDLLFYHIKLKCYVVIELKNTRFIPEYTGKLNFYLSAVDSLLKTPEDNPTIGLLLCREKNQIEVEFALRDLNKPIGVSEYVLVQKLPDNLKSSLPTIEEIEEELNDL
jgi:predicted nuclease of restriction endonuclease-like (RecB) superfamily